MVASKARKEARRRQLEQVKREERQKKTEDAVFGDYEDVEMTEQADTEATEQSNSAKEAKDVTEASAKSESSQTSKKRKKPKKDAAETQTDADATTDPKKPARFIVFVGSLPFSATAASIKAHFAKLEPLSIRHATSKETGKGRGFAFLEFDRFERMKDCLRLYHHSMFDDGLGGEPRRINIELTAGGGGGKSQERRERIRAKNDKLAGERARRAQTAREGKDKEGAKESKEGGGDNTLGRTSDRPPKFSKPTGANAVGARASERNASVHPSRLARIKG